MLKKKICYYKHQEIEQRDCNVVENNWAPRNQGPVKITSSAKSLSTDLYHHDDGVEHA